MKATTGLKLVENGWSAPIDPKDRRISELRDELDQLQIQLDLERSKQEQWARQLHDAINQSLFSAGLIAEVLPRLWERDPQAARNSLEDLRRLTFSAIAEMRVLLIESNPAALGHIELRELVRLLGNVTAGRLNVPVKFSGHGDWKLPTEVQSSLYELCKEVLGVIIRRARARQVGLQVAQTAASTSIHIHQEGDLFEIGREKVERFDNFLNAALGAERFGIKIEVKNQERPSSEVILRWHHPNGKEHAG